MNKEVCEKFFQVNVDRLEHLAFKAVKEGIVKDEFMLIAIDVNDPTWGELVDTLSPDSDWQSIRDRGEKPVCRGWVYTKVMVNLLSNLFTNIDPLLTSKLPQGTIRTVVLADGGISIFCVKPFPHFRDC